jgi:predicted DNA-binding protein
MATYGHMLVPRRKVSTTVYITPEQDAVLKALAQRTKVPVAEYIRQGIDLVVEKYRDQLPGQVDLTLGSR